MSIFVSAINAIKMKVVEWG